MKPALRNGLLAAGGLGVLAVFLFGSREIAERQRVFDQINALREELYESRRTAESCQRTLAAREGAFRRLDRNVDSLRREVRAFEDLDERGVPQERYEEYLEVFDGYNESVGTWEAAAEALRAVEDECRSAIERHNQLRDSLERRLATEGIEEG